LLVGLGLAAGDEQEGQSCKQEKGKFQGNRLEFDIFGIEFEYEVLTHIFTTS